MANDNKYVNGIFMEEKEGNYGPYISISISEEGLKNLKNTPANAKGYRNFTAGRQKNDNAKFSVKPYVAKSESNDQGGSDLPF